MSSTLDPVNFPHDSANAGKGHDIAALGPSDSSDSGSDMAGPGLFDDDLLALDRGTNEDSEAGKINATNAGASVGNLEADSDSDRYGTGEHLTAGREPQIRPDGDIDTDRIVEASEAGLGSGLDEAEQAEFEEMIEQRNT